MKKFLAIFLTTLLLVIPMVTIVASATSYNQESNEKKITDELKAEMENKKNNEYISIYIWLYDLGDDVVYSRLSNKLGKGINKDNEELYIDEKVKNKVEKYREKQKTKNSKNEKFDVAVFREEAEISEILTNEEIEKCIDSGKTTEQVIELSEQYQYLSDFRDSRAYVNASINEVFESSIKKSKCKNVNVDMLLPYVTMDCKKSYISKLSTMNIVKEIGLYSEPRFYNESELIENDESDYPKQNFTEFHDMITEETYGYKGSGIRIGVLEHKAEFMKSQKNAHLQQANIIRNTRYFSNPTYTEKSHAMVVLSILCGKQIINYSGIAPNSTVYLASYQVNGQMKDGLKWLIIDSNVQIVNISAKTTQNGMYTEYDQYLDCIVEQYRVVIVKSAGNADSEDDSDGNNNFVSSPGLAFNVITVGNATNDKDENDKYYMKGTSGYIDCGWQKPDIVAFGTNIRMLFPGMMENNLGSGTSYAAPMVSGTVALMMESNPELIGKPDLVKAILLASADENAISNVIPIQTDEEGTIQNLNNPLLANYHYASSTYFSETKTNIRQRSGAGLLNIQNAIKMSNDLIFYRYAISVTDIGSNPEMTTSLYYFRAGETVKITLVYENSQHEIFDVNAEEPIVPRNVFNLRILDSEDREIMASYNTVNNVESFTCTFSKSGAYKIKINCDSVAYDDGSSNTSSSHNDHDNFYVSLVLGCGCSLSEMNKSACVAYSHIINCKNCDFMIREMHCVEQLRNETEYFTVTYEMRYLFGFSSEEMDEKILVCDLPIIVVAVAKNEDHTVNIINESYDTEYLIDGTTVDIYTYWIFATNSNSEIISSEYQTVRVYFDKYLEKYCIINS